MYKYTSNHGRRLKRKITAKNERDKMEQEIIGMTGTVLVVASFLFNDQKTIRIVNAIGGLFLIVYGILINSASNIVLNSALTIIHIAKLYKMRKE